MRLFACLIVAPQRGYDEPATLSYAISSFCPTSADGLHEDEFWMSETKALFDTVVNKGILTKSWIRALLVLMALPPLAIILLVIFGVTPSWYVTLPVLALWITLILLRGLLVEWLIARRFFGDAPENVYIT